MYLDKESVSPPAPVPSGVRFLSGSQIRELLRYDDCVTAMDLAMRALSAGGCLLPLRQVLAVAANPPHFGIMSGFLDYPACFGVKVVGLLSGHGRGGASSHSGLMLLFDAQSGRPVAILDASELTRIRTAANSVLATRTLARTRVA
jgi:ornithine cyclodeaminase